MLAVSDATTITVSLVGLAVFLVLVVLVRLVMRRGSPPSWRRYRLGVFVERDPSETKEE